MRRGTRTRDGRMSRTPPAGRDRWDPAESRCRPGAGPARPRDRQASPAGRHEDRWAPTEGTPDPSVARLATAPRAWWDRLAVPADFGRGWIRADLPRRGDRRDPAPRRERSRSLARLVPRRAPR